MNQATQDFIRQHQDDDVRQLAFLGSKYPEVDMPFALDQIRGRKMARVKLPRWASIDGIIYPPHISMEQCSSEATALYKAELAERLLVSSCLVGQVSKASSILLIFLWSNAPLNLLHFTRQNWLRDCSACQLHHFLKKSVL